MAPGPVIGANSLTKERMHYLTKIWDSNNSAAEWFELCWDVPNSGHSIFDAPTPNEYQATMVTDTRWFAWLRFIEINDRSIPGVTESSGFVEIEQTGEFASTNADGSPGCPQYVLLRARTSTSGGTNALKDQPYQILYDKIDFYVEAIDNCGDPRADFDKDGDVDQADYGLLQGCLTLVSGGVPPGCECADLNRDLAAVDMQDLVDFENCATGPAIPLNPACDTQACCLGNGWCLDLPPTECASRNGTPQGIGTTCGSTNCP